MLHTESILRREMLEDRVMKAETKYKGVIDTEAGRV